MTVVYLNLIIFHCVSLDTGQNGKRTEPEGLYIAVGCMCHIVM